MQNFNLKTRRQDTWHDSVFLNQIKSLYLKQIRITEQHIDPSLAGLLCAACFCFSPEIWLTVRADLLNRRSSACRQDRHRARHLLCPGAVCGFGRLRHVQEKVNIFHIRLISHSLIIRRVTSVLIKLVLFFSPFSQTQGPSGPIYASSNPEYLSTDGKQGFGLLSTTE